MNHKDLKQHSFDLLNHGFLAPDHDNILFFLKALAYISVIALLALIAGIIIGQHLH